MLRKVVLGLSVATCNCNGQRSHGGLGASRDYASQPG